MEEFHSELNRRTRNLRKPQRNPSLRSSKEIDKKFNSIVQFSELKVSYRSEAQELFFRMQVRLAFFSFQFNPKPNFNSKSLWLDEEFSNKVKC